MSKHKGLSLKDNSPQSNFSASAETLRQRLELRRSSAASKHRNRKKYHRPTEKRQDHE
jgi:hypothetical protein